MKGKKTNNLKESAFFIKNAILKPKQVAYFLPSSKALIHSIAKKSQLATAKHIVELGPGTGGTTKGILLEMQQSAELCAVEINKDFVDYLNKSITDQRLHVRHDGAQNLTEIIKKLGWIHADVVISGIPFSTLPKGIAKEIMQSIYASIKPGGLFVAYQLRDKVGQLATPIFGEAIVHWEYKNFPPMRIFIWKKTE
ncbi:hypothetical protein MNBD_GAMMA01-2092 [hydrothermal vent metagenome]|uniref:Ribosomal RNA adenine methylase transferase N-terminal domain-containing protein n=1 Tax=hydrothermal vent metagenome TaxID=652676 RepID=A0A3B0VQL9_9ZZZZ